MRRNTNWIYDHLLLGLDVEYEGAPVNQFPFIPYDLSFTNNNKR